MRRTDNKMGVADYIYTERIKVLKKNLGSRCVHLANRKSVEGNRFIDVTLLLGGEKKKFSFDFPDNTSHITNADYDRLEELITAKLQ